QRGGDAFCRKPVRARLCLRLRRHPSDHRNPRHHPYQPGAAAGADGVRVNRAVERLAFPTILTVVFFIAYLPIKHYPVTVGGLDVRAYLEFAAYAALIFFVVRLIDVLIFELAVARSAVSTPQLLRGIIAFVLYAILFTSLFKQVFNYDI